MSPLPPPTITITAPVLDNAAVDALTLTLQKLGYNQIITENVTRITATRPTSASESFAVMRALVNSE